MIPKITSTKTVAKPLSFRRDFLFGRFIFMDFFPFWGPIGTKIADGLKHPHVSSLIPVPNARLKFLHVTLKPCLKQQHP